jgi:hypothetical protein
MTRSREGLSMPELSSLKVSWRKRNSANEFLRLRLYAMSPKVAGSIPKEVVALFNLPHPSSCTVAVGFVPGVQSAVGA